MHAPLTSDARADVVVVGAGVTGCSAAWHLARSGARVTLLEARDVASGASGRNGGFLLAGLAHRPVQLGAIVGERRAAELYDATAVARERMYEVAASIGADSYVERTGSLRLAVDAAELDELQQEATLLEEMGSVRVQRLDAHELPVRLVGSFLGGLRFADDGRLVPAAWVRALGDAAADAGAALHEQSPVVAIEDDDDGVVVRTQSGHEVRAEHVIVATEAWLSGIVPELVGHVLPYRSQVLAAQPLVDGAALGSGSARLLDHVTWSRRGWDYAQQTADGTLVVGGEQVEDVELLRSWEEAPVDGDQRWIESWIRRVLQVEPDVVDRWAGVLSQTPDGFPYVGALPGRSRVHVCGGWGGAGNVLGFACGGLVASRVLGLEAHVPEEFDAARISERAR
jgi:glycine/D-amino acid oxidase-like deaminating enzyme